MSETGAMQDESSLSETGSPNGEPDSREEVTPGPASSLTSSSPAANAADPASGSIDFLGDIELEASVELGRTNLSIEDVLRLMPGSVVHLNKMLGEPVDLIVGDRLIARGEVVVVDETFGLRITEMVSRGSH